jgi:hypothetical protein
VGLLSAPLLRRENGSSSRRSMKLNGSGSSRKLNGSGSSGRRRLTGGGRKH